MKQKTKLAIAISLFSMGAQAESLHDIAVDGLENDLYLEQLQNKFFDNINQIEEVEGMYLPQVGLTASGDYSLMPDNDLRDYNDATSASAGINVSYVLYDSAEMASKRIKSKESLHDYLTFAQYKQTVLNNISTLYYDTLRFQHILKVDKEHQKAVKKQQEQINQMFNVGLKTIVDVSEVQAELDIAESNVLSSENNLENTISQIYLYTGKPNQVPDEVVFDDLKREYEENGIDFWLAEIKENNYDYQKSIVEKYISKENIEVAESRNDFKASLTGGLNSNYNNRSPEDFDHAATIGFKIDLPVYSGGTHSAIEKQARTGYTNASVNLDYTFRKIQTELKIKLNELSSTKRQIQSLEKVVLSSKKSLDATESSYLAGSKDVVDLLNSNTQYFISLKNVANAEYDYLIKQNELLNLVGILNVNDI